MFSISGRGTVATGRVRIASQSRYALADTAVFQVERGVVNKGDEVEIVGLDTSLRTTLTGIGVFLCISEVCML